MLAPLKNCKIIARLPSVVLVTVLLGGTLASAEEPARPRIVNGSPTQQYPSAGALVTKGATSRTQVCSGTMIGCRTFLTAAHCVCDGSTFGSCGTPDPDEFQVFLQHVGFLDVAEIDVHPSFDFGKASDVAVLTLAADVDGIPPTPINTTGTPAHGTSGTITGFGVTDGARSDSGLKRAGAIETSPCSGAAPEPAHVCWAFQQPLGAPGSNSNTCYGDSGGPLFVDLGAGEVVAGITSGGVSTTCRASDVSYDANVYHNRSFIQAIGGADLANESCGAVSQVGDGDTEVKQLTGTLMTTLSTAAQTCRADVSRRYRKYTGAALRAHQACLDRANRDGDAGPCPDTTALAAIAKAAGELAPAKLARRCPPSVIPSIGGAGACSTADTPAELSSCLVNAADAAVAQMIDLEYADGTPDGSLAPGARSCQAQIGSSLGLYLTKVLKARLRCQERQDEGSVSDCPDGLTDARIDLFRSRAAAAIANRCSDAQISSLDDADPFGGSCAGSSTADELSACELDEHDAVFDELTGVLAPFEPSQTVSTTVSVAAGTEILRFTVNGVEETNDLDLYVKRGSAPTTSVYDARSVLDGTFEAIEVLAPAAGTWHVLVRGHGGANPVYQVTISEFR